MVVTDVTLLSHALVNVATANQPLPVIENKPTAKIRSEIGQAPGPNLIIKSLSLSYIITSNAN